MPEMNRQFYIQRAAEAREQMNAASDADERAIFERMAADYTALAEVNSPPPPSALGSLR